jgi:ubiquinone/menaquinone biosynthesis C-methylase UbiE
MTMLTRILEPEVMDTVSEAVDYDQMDHSGVNRLFIDDLLATLQPKSTASPIQLFDAGTGTAQIPLELMRRGIDAAVTATDLAEQMLIVAQQNVNAAGFARSIRLVLADCKQLRDASGSYDVVMSNSIVHHIPEPLQVLAELWRILKPGGLLFVRDLMRPDDHATLDGLVQTYAGASNDHQQQMFRDSLHAALTVDEVRGLLKQVGIPVTSVQATSNRHWTIAATRPAAGRL